MAVPSSMPTSFMPTMSSMPTSFPTSEQCQGSALNDLTASFFSAKCLQPGGCVIDEIADFMNEFFDELRFECISFTAFSVLLLVVCIQIGGIPPTDSRLERWLWNAFVFCVIAQFISVAFALILVVLAMDGFSYQYGHCMTNFRGLSMFNVLLPSFAFHPILLSKMAVLIYYNEIILQCLRVRWPSENQEMYSKYPRYFTFGIFAFIMGCGVLHFIFTGGFVFGMVFFFPMSVSLLLMMKAMHVLILMQMKCASSLGRNFNDHGYQAYCAMGTKMISDSLWFFEEEKRKSTMFRLTAGLSLSFVISPVVIFGALLAFTVYSKVPTAESMDLLVNAYRSFFSWFFGFTFKLPVLEFNLTLLYDIGLALAAMRDFASTTPNMLLYSSQVMTAFNLAMVTVKMIIGVTYTVLEATKLVMNNSIPVGQVAQFQRTSFAVKAMKKGVDIELVKKVEHKEPLRTLKNEGYTITQIMKLDKFELDELREGGYSAEEILRTQDELYNKMKWTYREFKSAGFTATELHDANLTLQELKEAAFFDWRDLAEAGLYTIDELRNVGYKIDNESGMNPLEHGHQIQKKRRHHHKKHHLAVV